MENNIEVVQPTTGAVAQQEEGTQVDIVRILRVLLHHAWIILLATVVCGLLTLGYTKLFVPNQYQSSVTIYATNNRTEGAVSGTDVYVGRAFEHLVKSLDTMKEVSEELKESYNCEISEQTLKSSIVSTSLMEDSSIIVITATHTDPTVAFQVATSIATVLPEYTANKTTTAAGQQQMVIIYESPRQPTAPSSPNVATNVIVGALAGLLLSCVVIAIIELCNTNIYQDDYLIETYGIPVLANIPEFADGKKRGKRYYRYSYSYSHRPESVEAEKAEREASSEEQGE